MNNKLATINIEARDLQQAARFYREVFGMSENTKRSHPPDFYYLESTAGHITLQPSRGGQPGNTIELGFEVEDLEKVVAALAGFPLPAPVKQTMGWGNAIETADLDGHRIIAYKLADR